MAAGRRQAGRIGGRRAEFEDYERLFAQEHLRKFSAPEVGFVDPSPVEQTCGACVHWFINPHSKWTPCEIMRRGENKPVPGGAVCRFWNQNGRDYSLLDVL